MGLILNIIASILKWALTPLLTISGYIGAIICGEFSDYGENKAISKDKYGNVLGKYLFNLVFIKKDGYSFGSHNDTISKVLGINKANGTLKRLGKLVCLLLNKIEKNHVEKASKNYGK